MYAVSMKAGRNQEEEGAMRQKAGAGNGKMNPEKNLKQKNLVKMTVLPGSWSRK
jgi:hypothetical protein